MGCKQSSVVEQVETPAPEAPVAVEEHAPEATVAVEAAPASSHPEVEAPPASAQPVAEEEPTAETPAVQEPAAVAEPEAAPVAAAPASETVSEVASSTEAITGSEVHEEVAEATETAAPAVEPVAEEPVAEHVVAEPEVTAPVEPESESAPVDEPKAEEEEPSVTFTSAGVSIESGVVFYQFSLVDQADPAKELTIKKRFNQFKSLHEEIAKLMASESNVPASQSDKFATYPALPPLPKAGATSVLFGRKNKNLTAEREAQFGKILNAIARHPVAYGSPVFQSFLA